MFDFAESIVINAPHQGVWELLREVDQWWLPSNSEHISLEHLDDRRVTDVVARLRIRETIGGISGEAMGTITAVEPGEAVTWVADATYRWFGLSVKLGEGVTWRVEPQKRNLNSGQRSRVGHSPTRNNGKTGCLCVHPLAQRRGQGPRTHTDGVALSETHHRGSAALSVKETGRSSSPAFGGASQQ
ncbi:MAG: SRPBCC family protein [Actinomycetia bacterium]|nr:SRPBCC family protein [Actinomycetes bacterium]